MHMRFPLCVIPAGGDGTRMGCDGPKCLQEVGGLPILTHVVHYWRKYCDSLVVVTKHEWLEQFKALNFQSGQVEIIGEPEPMGICAAVLAGLEHCRCPRQFVVALGDCLFDGVFDFEDLHFSRHGVGVMAADTDTARSYTVALGYQASALCPSVMGVIEKPQLGLGAYFLNWTAVLALENAGGITDVVGKLAQTSVVVPVPFVGRYLNVTYKEDLNRW